MNDAWIVLTNGAVPPMIIAGVHRYPDQSDAEHEPQSQRQSQVLGIPVGVPLAGTLSDRRAAGRIDRSGTLEFRLVRSRLRPTVGVELTWCAVVGC
ncbi:hypothetical protein SAMN05216281_1502 [Cryobacterium luteum]|nr:hypothetical protein SAMN05216281_1502 [Cryobacterium luteum]